MGARRCPCQTGTASSPVLVPSSSQGHRLSTRCVPRIVGYHTLVPSTPTGKLVPFNDLSRALLQQRESLLEITDRVISSSWLVQGPEHNALEQDLARYLGVAEVIGVGNGTDALELAFRALNQGDSRDTILTTANAGGYSATAAGAAGLQVRWCDVEEDSHCMDPDDLEAQIADDVLAVVVTHLYGRTADVDRIREVCDRGGVWLVEDCAQSIGAAVGLRKTGSLGDLATFSFYPTKNLGALGDGGAVATSNPTLAQTVRQLRQYGWREKYRVDTPGGRNSRLDELQAAYLRYRLPFVDSWNRRRREIISAYTAAAPDSVRVLPAPDQSHSAHLAVVVTNDTSQLAHHLAQRGVGTAVHYPLPDHWQAGRLIGTVLPVTERLAGKVLSLPCFPELRDVEVAQVCDALNSYQETHDR